MGRILIAAGLAVALAAGVVLIVIGSGGGDEEASTAAAPAECLRDWKKDVVAREAGRHNRAFHRYEEAQVGYVDPAAGTGAAISAEAGAGSCAVVFPSGELDSEPQYAGFVLAGGRWQPLTDSLPETEVGALQGAAIGAANATLTVDGELEPS